MRLKKEELKVVTVCHECGNGVSFTGRRGKNKVRCSWCETRLILEVPSLPKEIIEVSRKTNRELRLVK